MFIKISLNFVPKGAVNNIAALVQIMAWRLPGDNYLNQWWYSLLTHICVTRPQWLNIHVQINVMSMELIHHRLVYHVDVLLQYVYQLMLSFQTNSMWSQVAWLPFITPARAARSAARRAYNNRVPLLRGRARQPTASFWPLHAILHPVFNLDYKCTIIL